MNRTGYWVEHRFGDWYVCTQAFAHRFDWPFMHGPPRWSTDLPTVSTGRAQEVARNGSEAVLTPTGLVLIEEAGGLAYLGCIDPKSKTPAKELAP